MVLVLIAILSLLPAQPIQVPTLLSLNDAPLLLTTAVNPNYHSERCGIFLTNLKSTSQLQVSIIIYIYIYTYNLDCNRILDLVWKRYLIWPRALKNGPAVPST